MIKEGTKVMLHTGDRLAWSDSKTAIVVKIYDDDREPTMYLVRLEGADPSKPPFGLASVYEHEMQELPDIPEEKDNVNHPSHYTDGKYECIDYMESAGYTNDGYLFNAVKYISRAGKKDPSKFDEDLDKAVWYLKRKIEKDREEFKPYISNADYIRGKGLENTVRGLALDLIYNKEYELAARVLTSFRHFDKDA